MNEAVAWTPKEGDLPLPAGRMKGRAILVTGAARGIGRAIAKLFAAEGAKIALLDREETGLRDIARETGGLAIAQDLTDFEKLPSVVGEAASFMGHLDGLVNAAGVYVNGPIGETDAATWKLVMDVNLTAPFLLCRAAETSLREAPTGYATILNISSGVGLSPYANRSAYATSKGGLIILGKVLAMELAPNIRVNTICPGLIDTPMVEALAGHNDLAVTLQKYALKRLGLAEEVAQAALFLSSGASSFITGATMAVDGGRTFH
ncbi:MAG: dehydrogenase [Rhizobiaceae bacterium MnEN-MB40S]|nr:MAG: dehydrogenase [Rhizobiaceae bacterium MnEN-MB40S]